MSTLAYIAICLGLLIIGFVLGYKDGKEDAEHDQEIKDMLTGKKRPQL